MQPTEGFRFVILRVPNSACNPVEVPLITRGDTYMNRRLGFRWSYVIYGERFKATSRGLRKIGAAKWVFIMSGN